MKRLRRRGLSFKKSIRSTRKKQKSRPKKNKAANMP